MRLTLLKYKMTLLTAGAVCLAASSGIANDAIQVGYVEGQALQPIAEAQPSYSSQPVYQESCPNCDRQRRSHGSRFLTGLFRHKKLHSADEGWSRIIKQPVRRSPVRYRRYWPSKWAGQPGFGLNANPAYPMVYMPTDTTQMGYYYQGAPQWQPNPSMIPPAPHPYQWHRRSCPMGLPVNHQGEVIYHQSSSYGTPQQAYPQQTAPQYVPQQNVPQQVVPTPAPVGPQNLNPPNPVGDKSA